MARCSCSPPPDSTALAQRQVGAIAYPCGAFRTITTVPTITPSGGYLSDGSAVAYVVKTSSGEQLLAQPLDGWPARMLGSFAVPHVASFDWSPDGAQLPCSAKPATPSSF